MFALRSNYTFMLCNQGCILICQFLELCLTRTLKKSRPLLFKKVKLGQLFSFIMTDLKLNRKMHPKK